MTPDDSGRGEPVVRSFQFSTRNRAAAIALAVAIIALGGVFVVFGLVLLAGLAAVGTVLGAGIMAYHRITGRWPRFLRPAAASRTSLDPSREVFPTDSPASRGAQPNDVPLPPRV